jgi:O-antigen/teichoic acid export membrane protein
VRHTGEVHFKNIRALLAEMSKFGAWVQLANLAQLMNYRLSYYFIEWYAGRQPLGIYELGTKLSEVVWIFPKSICLVQYARLANNQDRNMRSSLLLAY